MAQQRNAVLVGETGTGKTHLAIAIARSCIRSGPRGWFYNVVNLVNRLETETRNGHQGRLAEHLTRMALIILDELGYLTFAQAGGQLPRAATIRAAGRMKRLTDWTLRQRNSGTLPRIRLLGPDLERSRKRQSSTALFYRRKSNAHAFSGPPSRIEIRRGVNP
jgi:IstB-like ATP binding protein